jgi:hypothetical protein
VPYGTSPKGLSHAKLSHADLISIVEAYVKTVCIRENYFKHSSLVGQQKPGDRSETKTCIFAQAGYSNTVQLTAAERSALRNTLI